MAGTYLYIYRNDKRREVYIGIGENMSRIWEKHNDRATTLLNAPDTAVFVTSKKFPSREAAEMAESAAICAAAAAGATVLSDSDEHKTLTNIAKVAASRHLVPAVYTRSTTASPLQFTSLKKTAVVVVSVEEIDGGERPSLHGGRGSDVFAERARRYWPLGAAERRRQAMQKPGEPPVQTVERLVMVQKGTGTILGAWKLRPEQWKPTLEKWEFLLAEPIDDWRGRRLDWGVQHPSNTVTWSTDIKP